MKLKLQRTLTLLLALSLLTCPILAVSSFPDVAEYSEYYSAIDYVSSKGIIVGDNSGNFNPNQSVTRAEMAVILCRVLELTENMPTTDTFSDVPVDYWANSYIAKAANLGIVTGYNNGTFSPDGFVTYEQAITMVVRSIEGGSDKAQSAGGYPDGFILVAQEKYLLEGLLAKKGETMSRGDIAQILYNYYTASTIIE